MAIFLPVTLKSSKFKSQEIIKVLRKGTKYQPLSNIERTECRRVIYDALFLYSKNDVREKLPITNLLMLFSIMQIQCKYSDFTPRKHFRKYK